MGKSQKGLFNISVVSLLGSSEEMANVDTNNAKVCDEKEK